MTRKIALGAFLHPSGHHVAAWRHPQAASDAGINIRNYIRLAQLAEAAKFDLVFLADQIAVPSDNLDYVSHTTRATYFEPLTLISALAAATQHIGLVATVSTSFNSPYNMARYIASLDHISGGRAGWNLVTSGSALEGENFGLGDDYRLHANRYRQAAEFADVVRGLWDSFEDGAVPDDRAAGRYINEARVHALHHVGEHYRVKGPLSQPRSPQGQPVLVQAGSSPAGRDLAARSAELVFTAQPSLAQAQEFYADVKARATSYGRDPDSIRIMPGVFPVVGQTEAEAQEKFATLQDLITPEVGREYLSLHLGGIDLSGLSDHDPVPDIAVGERGHVSRPQLLLQKARSRNLTIRDLYLEIAGARGHWQIVGTAESIADQLEAYFTQNAADGFNVMPPSPTGLDDFVTLVVPELRRRGLMREDYDARTLRGHLGLAIPPNRYSATARQPERALA
ncbi:LLM class flavin-dependent oxidoreductase [Paracoccus laeviglucosivorans]|uniref:FMN-dependent oxidoreductase, nitrilotriacetate monooxygenase family n=1 Tax=Paracoccus laeviglucosivorans TaxID=1197861 RepID=A0A521ESB6_9RHOB|nr:LLM class flavin-dependent oxidoreductase [Paracoccus laeviglucosivorans]SMO86792.1 FMN-dependent oxidoreductase, nitrilotriacetate monooxygenase family [Paracoccus laeviglucosivorans]